MAAYFGAVAIAIVASARRAEIASAGGIAVLVALSCTVAVAIALAARLAPGRRHDEPGLESVPAAALGRLLLYGLAPAFAATTLATAKLWLLPDGPRVVLLFACTALAGIGVALLVALRLRGGAEPRRWLHALDLVVFNAIVVLLGAELVIRVLQRVAPSQLLWDDTSIASSLLSLRHCPEPWYFRYRCNERGYPDEPFVEPAAGDYAVALVADSFGVGMVPWSHHFATLAERELRDQLGPRYARVAIDDFGIAGIDLPEYRYLVDTEIADQAYAEVVLCLFVGNDLGDVASSEGGPLRRMLRFQGWLAPEVARRTFLVLRGTEAPEAAAAELPDEPAFLADPALEPPTFAPDEFRRIELDRIRYALPSAKASEAVYREALATLDAIHERLGARLLVMVIPDEFQVNDALWEQLLPAATRLYARGQAPDPSRSPFDRDYPQRRLREWADARNVRLIDLLPTLREAEREGRTYHLRDTHWNAHGNRVAARELANVLLRDAPPALARP